MDIEGGGGLSDALAQFTSPLSTDGWKLACVDLSESFLLDLFFNLACTSRAIVNIPMTAIVPTTTTIASQCVSSLWSALTSDFQSVRYHCIRQVLGHSKRYVYAFIPINRD